MANVNPPQPVPQLGPQPDFVLLGQGLQQVTTELGNFANLPPFAQGNALMQQMLQFQQQVQQQTQQFQQEMRQQTQQFQQEMRQQTQQFRQEMQQSRQEMQEFRQEMQQQFQQEIRQINQNITAVRDDIRTLRDDININHRATEYNSIARIENSVARRSNHPLTALRDYTTNTEIPDFPATPAQLANMTPLGLDPILRSLGLPVNGTVVMKRQRLRFYIGLVDMPQ